MACLTYQIGQALRTMKMQAAYRKAEAAHPRENAPSAEQIRSLGLLGKEDEAAAVLKQLGHS